MNREARSVLFQIVGRKYSVLFVLMWVALALYIGLPCLLNNMAGIALCGVFGMVFFVVMIWYFTGTSSTKKAVKTLVCTGKLDYVNEVLTGDYNSNSRVGFSRHLLYDKRTRIVVAYDDIVWIHSNSKTNNKVNFWFCTVDGKKHGSSIDNRTLTEFLKRRNGIVLGDTPQNRAVYEMKVREFKDQRGERGR